MGSCPIAAPHSLLAQATTNPIASGIDPSFLHFACLFVRSRAPAFPEYDRTSKPGACNSCDGSNELGSTSFSGDELAEPSVPCFGCPKAIEKTPCTSGSVLLSGPFKRQSHSFESASTAWNPTLLLSLSATPRRTTWRSSSDEGDPAASSAMAVGLPCHDARRESARASGS